MLNSLDPAMSAVAAAAALGLAAYLLLRRRRPRPLAELVEPSANPTRDERRHDAKHGSHMMMAVFVTLMVSVLSFVMTFDGLLADLARISGVTIDNKLEALHTAFVISVMITVVWTILFAVRLYATTLRAFVAIFGLGVGFLIWCLTVDGVANYSAWAGAGSELIYRSNQVDEAEKRVAGMVERGRELPGLISAVEAEARIARSKAECEKTSGCLSGSAGQGSVYVTMIGLADRRDRAAQASDRHQPVSRQALPQKDSAPTEAPVFQEAHMKSALMISAALLRGLSALIGYWKPLLVILFFLSPTGPHVRWTQSYVGSPDHPRFIRCDYLGARGIVATNFAPDCPLIVWIDVLEWAS